MLFLKYRFLQNSDRYTSSINGTATSEVDIEDGEYELILLCSRLSTFKLLPTRFAKDDLDIEDDTEQDFGSNGEPSLTPTSADASDGKRFALLISLINTLSLYL